MNIIRLDLKNGLVFIDSIPIELDQKGTLADSIAKLCSTPTSTKQGGTRYRLLRKVSIFGKSTDVVIEIEENRSFSVTFLFDLIEFFDSSILESRIIQACDKALHLKFKSNHPSVAFLDSSKWGSATFFYDARQGDLSLEIRLEQNSVN